MGPYEIIGTHGNYSFTLRLPSQFRTVHPVFHVSQLETATPDPFPLRQQAPPPPVEIEGDIEYEVSEILDTKLDRRFRPDNALHYLVRWTGYEGTDNETSWIPARDLEHAPELVQSFHCHYPNKPKPAITTS